ncbi:MAG: glycosyltransferase family 9 protein [Ignavibacterium sp.]|nr:glycosyltransferase family 9 protein [Ignavibacterium sp.]
MQIVFDYLMYKSITKKISGNFIIENLLQFFFDVVLKLIRFLSKLFSKKGESVCIISIHKLGDSIFTFDTINSIKTYYKNRDVFIICNYNSKDIYNLIHPKEFVLNLPKSCFHFNDRYLDSKARKILRSLNPEIIIDITGVMTSASLIFNSTAKEIFGINRKLFRSIYDKFIETNTNLVSKQIYLNAIKEIIPINPIITNKVRNNNSNSIKTILIAPFAGWKSREWGLGKYITLSERLSNDYEVELLFDQTFITREIIDYLSINGIKYYISKSVNELINKIKEYDLVIGNDSGPIHIAEFLGKYTFTIYGPTNPYYHKEDGENHEFIQKVLPCSPTSSERLCFTDGGKDGCPSFECMSLLSVDEVYEKLLKSISKWNSD